MIGVIVRNLCVAREPRRAHRGRHTGRARARAGRRVQILVAAGAGPITTQAAQHDRLAGADPARPDNAQRHEVAAEFLDDGQSRARLPDHPRPGRAARRRRSRRVRGCVVPDPGPPGALLATATGRANGSRPRSRSGTSRLCRFCKLEVKRSRHRRRSAPPATSQQFHICSLLLPQIWRYKEFRPVEYGNAQNDEKTQRKRSERWDALAGASLLGCQAGERRPDASDDRESGRGPERASACTRMPRRSAIFARSYSR